MPVYLKAMKIVIALIFCGLLVTSCVAVPHVSKREYKRDHKIKRTPSTAKLSQRDASNTILYFLLGAFIFHTFEDIEQFLIGGPR